MNKNTIIAIVVILLLAFGALIYLPQAIERYKAQTTAQQEAML